MPIDPRFLAETGREVFTGNELLVKGCLEVEGGVHLMTGYPGSPISGFFDTMGDIKDLLQQKGIRAFQANNEALGAAAANGSQMAACRAIVTMKSVGVHVASDALIIGNLAGPNPEGGVVVVSGDDPWCDSTQVPADSRFLHEHMRIPVVEPGTSQELKDWIDLSFKLGSRSGLYVGYIHRTGRELLDTPDSADRYAAHFANYWRSVLLAQSNPQFTRPGGRLEDYLRKHLRANTPYDKLVEAGSQPKAKELNFTRLEGKEYVMQEGDVVYFRFNV